MQDSAATLEHMAQICAARTNSVRRSTLVVTGKSDHGLDHTGLGMHDSCSSITWTHFSTVISLPFASFETKTFQLSQPELITLKIRLSKTTLDIGFLLFTGLAMALQTSREAFKAVERVIKPVRALLPFTGNRGSGQGAASITFYLPLFEYCTLDVVDNALSEDRSVASKVKRESTKGG